MSVDISTLQSLGLTQTAQTTATKKNTDLGQDEFLKLMTTQLQNQNPLDPQDGAAFVAQLAQFSMVSGIQSLGTKFDSFSSSVTGNQALQASQLIGKDVTIASSKGVLGVSGGISGNVELPSDSSQVTLRVRNAGGSTVRTLDLGSQVAGKMTFDWDGLLDDGASRAAPGVYKLTLEAMVDGKNQALETNIRTPVEAVTLGGSQGMEVDLGALGRHGLGDIREVL